ncbi:hypothetical protein SAMN04487934_101545 [Eubacterium ruminantium]|nr:hypothetical protein SAMN04487934_101545 [Eubacterium ruminantium]
MPSGSNNNAGNNPAENNGAAEVIHSTDVDLERDIAEGGNRKKYKHELFRLSEKDCIAIGCNKAEIEEFRKINQQIDAINSQEADLGALFNEDAEELRQSNIDKKIELEEKIYSVFLKAADRNARSWEYNKSTMPVWLQCTGNISTINQFMRTYGDSLSVVDKAKLLKRRQISQKVIVNEKEAEKRAESEAANLNTGINIISNSENDAYIDGLNMTSYQTSGNGCWSVSTQLQAQARGYRNITQTDIRSFRPDYRAGDIKELIKPDEPLPGEAKPKKSKVMNEMAQESYNILESDSSNNVIDRGEAFLKLAPGSMMKGIQISAYDNDVRKMGISREEYLKRSVQVARKNILNAIKEDKAPVSFLAGGHYITIIGIDANNKVKYKDSVPKAGGSLETVYETKLETLMKRLTAKTAGYVRMEWGAEMKLSQDGKQIYGVPSNEYTVGDDGEIQRATELSYLQNTNNGFQSKDGTFVVRNNKSEGHNEDKKREENLKNGGVNISEQVYLPKKVNINLLKNKAAKRSVEEEARLQQHQKDFYGIEHKPGEPYKTKEELEHIYSEAETASTTAFRDAQNSAVNALRDALDNANFGPDPAPIRATSSTRAYDRYINNLYKNEKMMDKKTGFFEMKNNFAKAIAASKLKAEGKKFNEKDIKSLGDMILSETCIGEIKKEDMMKYLTIPDRVKAFDKMKGVIMGEIYGVKPGYREAFLNEMKLLADNMMPKEGRSTEYQKFHEAVQAFKNIDLNGENAGKTIAEANMKLMDAAKKYMAGKEKVRVSTGGNDRFANALDAVSIIAVFAPGTARIEVDPLFKNINKERGMDKLKGRQALSNKDYVMYKDFGGERAANRKKEIVAEQNKKTQKNKKTEIAK